MVRLDPSINEDKYKALVNVALAEVGWRPEGWIDQGDSSFLIYGPGEAPPAAILTRASALALTELGSPEHLVTCARCRERRHEPHCQGIPASMALLGVTECARQLQAVPAR